jgi:stage III sporulation protein AB
VGAYYSLRLKKREETLRELTQMLCEMSILIRHRRLSVGEIFSELERYEFIANIGDSENTRRWRDNWNYVADGLTYLKAEERNVLKSVGATLGTSDADGQLAMLKANAELLEGFRAEAYKEYLAKGKLYRTCGVLAGIFAAIMII